MLLALVLAAWWHLSSTREHALAAAKHHCDQMQVQFLDGSVMANGIRFSRSSSGSVVLVQRFRFEFSTTGDERYTGYAELVGRRVLKMELEPHRI